MVSVCMGVYNGEKYIEEQLLSIYRQTLPPDEVILCDDGSRDGTVEVIRRFISGNHLEGKWRLCRNTENKGYPGNFYYGMSLCSGDIVFLADQDDIWDARKLERMCEVFRQQPDALAVCCKFGLVDREGGDIHTLMKPARSKGTKAVRAVDIEDVFYKCEWPGMVLAYRRSWYEGLWRRCGLEGKEGPGEIPHDFLVCAWAAEKKGFLQMDEELAYHRRHEENTGGEEHRISRLLNRDRKLKEIREYNRILEAFAKEDILQTHRGKEALERKRESMRARLEALESGRLGRVAGNIWKNRRSIRPATAICDILITLKKRRPA